MIQVHMLGYNFVNALGIDVNRPNGSGDYLFLHFRRSTEVQLDGEYQTVLAGTYLLYKKGDPQIYRKKDGHFVNDWIHFDIEGEDSFFERLKIPFNTPMVLPNNKSITDMTSRLLDEVFDVGPHHKEIVDQMAHTLFYKFSDLYSFAQKNGNKMMLYHKQLVDIRKKILNYEYQPEGAEEMADKLGVSISYVQHLYKDFFHRTIQQDIIWGRISHAANMLNSTNLSVAEIAAQCGYDNVEHFSRQFKKLRCCSPSGYRKGFAESGQQTEKGDMVR